MLFYFTKLAIFYGFVAAAAASVIARSVFSPIFFICTVSVLCLCSVSNYILLYCRFNEERKKQQTNTFISLLRFSLRSKSLVQLYTIGLVWSGLSIYYYMCALCLCVSYCFFQYRKYDPGFCHFYALSIYLSLCLTIAAFYHSVCMRVCVFACYLLFYLKLLFVVVDVTIAPCSCLCFSYGTSILITALFILQPIDAL